MDYFLTEEQKAIRDLVRKIADEKIRPVRARLDAESEFPHEILDVFARSDLCGIFIPEKYVFLREYLLVQLIVWAAPKGVVSTRLFWPVIGGVWRKRLWMFVILMCAQVGEELLKVGIVAKQLSTGCDQSVNLFVA